MEKLWKSKLPMKLKVFMWQTYHGRLQTGIVLKKWKWKGNMNYVVCGALETRDHILFSCVPAKFLWISFKEALGWDGTPDSLEDFLDHWHPLDVLTIVFRSFLWGQFFGCCGMLETN
jgi:hypothetical protein